MAHGGGDGDGGGDGTRFHPFRADFLFFECNYGLRSYGYWVDNNLSIACIRSSADSLGFCSSY